MNMDNEQKEVEETKPTEATPTEDGGDKKEEAPQSISEKKAELAERKQMIADEKEILSQEAELKAKRALGGVTEAGSRTVKKKLTDEEYAEKFSRGEVNPLEDDVNKSKTE